MTQAQINPLLQPSNLPFGAVPFDRIKKEHFLPGIDASLQEARSNLQKLRDDHDRKAPADFANTILALETGSESLGRIAGLFFNLLGTNSDDEMQEMAKTISASLAEFSSDVALDPKIFARVKEVWDARDRLALKGEELRLTDKTFKEFSRNGGLLSEADKAKLRELDRQLAQLSPQFSDHVLKATNDFKLFLTRQDQLLGLPESAIEAAAAAALAASHTGEWLITLHAPSFVPFMTYSAVRELREKVWRAYMSRAFRDSASNEKLTVEIARLRHERALVLGYPNHAAFVLEERMAESTQTVSRFLDSIVGSCLQAAKRDVAEIKKIRDIDPNSGGGEIMPWDFTYYAEKLKMKLFDLDQEQLRPYFKLEDVVAGVFTLAGKLYGLQFKPQTQLPTSHPDVRVYEVSDSDTGRHIGLFYTDFYPRESKRGGGWMSSFRDQGLQGGKVERPHVSIVCNFTQPTANKPSLLTFEEVRTLFHEFGHALHGLLSECKYVSIGGTNVYWDFVELPSQIMENWAVEKDGLDLFAKHYLTGEKIPKELVEKVRASDKFLAGYASLRQMLYAILDMAWHSADPSKITDIAKFEAEVTEKVRLFPLIEGTNQSCTFSHIFAGGYSAGYYSYKWAEVLDADAFEYFKEQGIFNRDVARKFREFILAKGGTEHPMQLYKKFRGREPDPEALLRRDGLI